METIHKFYNFKFFRDRNQCIQNILTLMTSGDSHGCSEVQSENLYRLMEHELLIQCKVRAFGY